MVIQPWLSLLFVGIHKRLRSGQNVSARKRPTKCHHVPAAIEMLEERRMLTAIIAVSDSYVVPMNPGSAAPTTLNVLANDSGGSGGLFIESVSSPANGTVTIQQGSSGTQDGLQFTPGASFSGTESLSYIVADMSGNMGTGTVSITVSSSSASSSGSGSSDGSSLSSGSGTSSGSGGTSGSGSDSVSGGYTAGMEGGSSSGSGSGSRVVLELVQPIH